MHGLASLTKSLVEMETLPPKKVSLHRVQCVPLTRQINAIRHLGRVVKRLIHCMAQYLPLLCILQEDCVQNFATAYLAAAQCPVDALVET